MSVLKAPPKQPKNATLQVRIDEDLKYKVEKYAEFLETTTAYVVSEALRLVFTKDSDFREWLEGHRTNNDEADAQQTLASTATTPGAAALTPVTPRPNGKDLFR
jgi:predicted transcriptional regulator